jgi:glycerophosphoryl diester phosphodiesterase
MKIPALVGHRGYPRHYPENTLVGFEAAIRAGALYVETDVQLSADQVPVLFHDRTLMRVCGAAGAIHDHTAEQLKQFRAREFERFGYKFTHEPIPTLAQFVAWLAQHPQVTAFVEIKRVTVERFGHAPVLSRVLRDLKPVLKQCVLISYSLETLLHARHQSWPRVGAVIDRWHERSQPIIKELRPEYLFCDVNGLPRFGRLGLHGAQLAVYEVADAPLALRLSRRGVQLIETFAIGELRAQLELLTAQ